MESSSSSVIHVIRASAPTPLNSGKRIAPEFMHRNDLFFTEFASLHTMLRRRRERLKQKPQTESVQKQVQVLNHVIATLRESGDE